MVISCVRINDDISFLVLVAGIINNGEDTELLRRQRNVDCLLLPRGVLGCPFLFQDRELHFRTPDRYP